jgi:hypothetical protein
MFIATVVIWAAKDGGVIAIVRQCPEFGSKGTGTQRIPECHYGIAESGCGGR